MSTYQSAYTGTEIDAAVGSITAGAENPTPSTVGSLGKIYRNTTTGVLYKCIKIDGIVYTWLPLDCIDIGTVQPVSGIWLEEVV